MSNKRNLEETAGSRNDDVSFTGSVSKKQKIKPTPSSSGSSGGGGSSSSSGGTGNVGDGQTKVWYREFGKEAVSVKLTEPMDVEEFVKFLVAKELLEKRPVDEVIIADSKGENTSGDEIVTKNTAATAYEIIPIPSVGTAAEMKAERTEMFKRRLDRTDMSLNQKEKYKQYIAKNPGIVESYPTRSFRALLARLDKKIAVPDELDVFSKDGLSLGDKVRTNREKRLTEFVEFWDTERFVLIRSPPESGKTSFSQLLGEYLLKNRPEAKVHLFTCLDHRVMKAKFAADSAAKYGDACLEMMAQTKEVNDLFKREFPFLFEQPYSKDVIYFIMDEAQALYGVDTLFWVALKRLQSDCSFHSIHILCLGMYDDVALKYGSPHYSPFQFNKTRGIEFLKLSEEEYEELILAHNKAMYRGRLRVQVTEHNVKESIWRSTQGYIGLIRGMLTMLDDYLIQKDELTDQQITQHYWDCARALRGESRALDWVLGAVWEYRKDKEKRKILEDIILEGKMKKTAKHQELLRAGVLAEFPGEKVGFAADLIEALVVSTLYAGTHRKDYPSGKEGMEEFLEDALKIMKPSNLRKALSTGADGELYERVWQMEFFRCALSALQEADSVNPDFTSRGQSTGFIDFYIGDNKGWGIKILRSGNKTTLSEHASRFRVDATGTMRYYGVPLKQWAVLDFRTKNNVNTANDGGDHIWHIVVKSNYSEAVIKRKGHQNKSIRLSGDKMAKK